MNKSNSRKRSAKQKTRHLHGHRWSMLAICAVLVLLIAMITVSSITLKAKDDACRAQEIELEKQIEEEKARTEEIEDLEEYVGSDEYVEDVAKEKLGLVHEGDIVFRAE